MDVVTLISWGDCLDSKPVSCFAFLFPSLHSSGITTDNNSIIHGAEEHPSKNIV